MSRPRTCELSRFWCKVDKTGGCWIWTAGKDSDGYGAFQITQPYRQVKSHRMSFCLANGSNIRDLSSDVIIRHTCDNPSCVNPEHLLAGTVQDNVDDKMRRGRFVASRSNTRLTENQVLEIRSRAEEGEVHSTIAESMGVCRSNVTTIANRRTWKHL